MPFWNLGADGSCLADEKRVRRKSTNGSRSFLERVCAAEGTRERRRDPSVKTASPARHQTAALIAFPRLFRAIPTEDREKKKKENTSRSAICCRQKNLSLTWSRNLPSEGADKMEATFPSRPGQEHRGERERQAKAFRTISQQKI